jgi:hypothetical protein
VGDIAHVSYGKELMNFPWQLSVLLVNILIELFFFGARRAITHLARKMLFESRVLVGYSYKAPGVILSVPSRVNGTLYHAKPLFHCPGQSQAEAAANM